MGFKHPGAQCHHILNMSRLHRSGPSDADKKLSWHSNLVHTVFSLQSHLVVDIISMATRVPEEGRSRPGSGLLAPVRRDRRSPNQAPNDYKSFTSILLPVG